MSKKTNRFLAAMLTVMMLVSMIPADLAVATVSEPWTLFPQATSSPQASTDNSAASDNTSGEIPSIVVETSTPKAELAPGVIDMVGFGYFKDAGSLAQDGYSLVKVDAQGNIIYLNNEYTLFNGSQTMSVAQKPVQQSTGDTITIDVGDTTTTDAQTDANTSTGDVPTPSSGDREIQITVEPEQAQTQTETPTQAPTSNETAGRTAEISILDDLATLNDRLGISANKPQALETADELIHSKDLGLNRPFTNDEKPDADVTDLDLIEVPGKDQNPTSETSGLVLLTDAFSGVDESFTGCYVFWDATLNEGQGAYKADGSGNILVYNQLGMVVGYWNRDYANDVEGDENLRSDGKAMDYETGSVVYFGEKNTNGTGVIDDDGILDRQQMTELVPVDGHKDRYTLNTINGTNENGGNTLVYGVTSNGDMEAVAYIDPDGAYRNQKPPIVTPLPEGSQFTVTKKWIGRPVGNTEITYVLHGRADIQGVVYAGSKIITETITVDNLDANGNATKTFTIPPKFVATDGREYPVDYWEYLGETLVGKNFKQLYADDKTFNYVNTSITNRTISKIWDKDVYKNYSTIKVRIYKRDSVTKTEYGEVGEYPDGVIITNTKDGWLKSVSLPVGGYHDSQYVVYDYYAKEVEIDGVPVEVDANGHITTADYDHIQVIHGAGQGLQVQNVKYYDPGLYNAVKVNKVWDNKLASVWEEEHPGQKLPTLVTVRLIVTDDKGMPVEAQTVTKTFDTVDNGYLFTQIPKGYLDNNNVWHPYGYSVVEVGTHTSFTAYPSGVTFDPVANQYVATINNVSKFNPNSKINRTGVKYWMGANGFFLPEEQIPEDEIIIELWDGEENTGKTFSLKKGDGKNWKFVFEGLEEFDALGVRHNYHVKERTNVSGYTAVPLNDDIFNIPDLGSGGGGEGTGGFRAVKTWVGDGIEPQDVTLRLQKRATPGGQEWVDVPGTDWSVYATDGTYIMKFFSQSLLEPGYEYRLSEDEVNGANWSFTPGESVGWTAEDAAGAVIKTISGVNGPKRDTGDLTARPVHKVWKDGGATLDKTKYHKVTLELLQNGVRYTAPNVTNPITLYDNSVDGLWDNDLVYIFENLPKYSDATAGTEYVYTIREIQSGEGAYTCVSEPEGDGWKLTNTLKQASEQDLSFKKYWSGFTAADIAEFERRMAAAGKTGVEFKLLQSGVEVKRITLTIDEIRAAFSGNPNIINMEKLGYNWPKYNPNDGTPHTYKLEEVMIEDAEDAGFDLFTFEVRAGTNDKEYSNKYNKKDQNTKLNVTKLWKEMDGVAAADWPRAVKFDVYILKADGSKGEKLDDKTLIIDGFSSTNTTKTVTVEYEGIYTDPTTRVQRQARYWFEEVEIQLANGDWKPVATSGYMPVRAEVFANTNFETENIPLDKYSSTTYDWRFYKSWDFGDLDPTRPADAAIIARAKDELRLYMLRDGNLVAGGNTDLPGLKDGWIADPNGGGVMDSVVAKNQPTKNELTGAATDITVYEKTPLGFSAYSDLFFRWDPRNKEYYTIVTNYYVGEAQTQVTIEKDWGDLYADLPNVLTVMVQAAGADGSSTYPVELTVADRVANTNIWRKTIPLTKLDRTGRELQYTAAEVSLTYNNFNNTGKPKTVLIGSDDSPFTRTDSNTLVQDPTTGNWSIKIQNQHKNTTKYAATKVWSPDRLMKTDNTGETQAKKITVTLLQRVVGTVQWSDDIKNITGTSIGTKTQSFLTPWRIEFTNLPKYVRDSNSLKEYEYAVREDSIDGYTTSNGGVSDSKNTITNTQVTGKLKVEKKWVNLLDAENPAITILLIRGKQPTGSSEITWESDANAYDSVTLTRGIKLEHTFEHLPLYYYSDEGVAGKFVYRVKESNKPDGVTLTYDPATDPATDYSNTITPTAGTTPLVTVTNSRDQIDFNVEKTWVGDANFTYMRDQGITVTITTNPAVPVFTGEAVPTMLVRNLTLTGNPAATPSTVDNNTVWTWVLTELKNLPHYYYTGNSFKKIEYTITETVNGYTVSYPAGGQKLTGDSASSRTFKITNTMIPAELSGSKTWYDTNNAFESRPDFITFIIKRNGEAVPPDEISAATVTKTGAGTISKNGNVIKVEPGAGLDAAAKKTAINTDSNWNWEITGLPKHNPSTGAAYTYTIEETPVPTGYNKSESGMNVGNTLKSTDLVIYKVWVDENQENNVRPSTLTFNLYRWNPAESKPVGLLPYSQLTTGTPGVVAAPTDANHWTITISGLPDGWNYELEEIVPEHYEVTPTNGVVVKNGTLTNTRATVTISGIKSFDEAFTANRPDSFYVELWRRSDNHDDEQVGAKGIKRIILADGSDYNFGKWPKYDPEGDLYDYYVIESEDGKGTALPGYTMTHPDVVDVGDALIRNMNNATDTGAITVAKTWVDKDGQTKYLGDVSGFTVTYTLVGTVPGVMDPVFNESGTLNEDAWTKTHTVPTHYKGQLITYTLEETSGPVDFAVTYWIGDEEKSAMEVTTAGVTMEIRNRWTSDTASGVKTWIEPADEDSIQPTSLGLTLKRKVAEGDTDPDPNFSIPFTIYPTAIPAIGANPTHAAVTVAKDGDTPWSYVFSNLDQYYSATGKYTYYVEEENVPEHFDLVPRVETDDPMNVKNTVETIEVTVAKEWAIPNGADEAELFKDLLDTIAGRMVTVNLYRSFTEDVPTTGEGVTPYRTHDKLTSSAAYSFEDLPKYGNNNGRIELYYYKAVEVSVKGFNTTERREEDGTITFINTVEPTSFKGYKAWVDADYLNVTRPESISLTLYRKVNGAKDLNWSYTFPVAIDTAKNTFEFNFAKLRAKDDTGAEYTYYVVENEPDPNGYTVSYQGEGARESYTTETITNTLKTIDIDVIKTWMDDGDFLIRRDAGITVTLTADKPVFAQGFVDEKTLVKNINDPKWSESKVNGNDVWTWNDVFTGLPMYYYNANAIGEKFELVTYTITEVQVDGYGEVDPVDAVRQGQTTTYNVELENMFRTDAFSGSKKWLMGNFNQEGYPEINQPKSVQIQIRRYLTKNLKPNLEADGEIVPDAEVIGHLENPITVTGPDWKWNLSGLTAAGAEGEYTYYAVEMPVTGYDTSYVDGKGYAATTGAISNKPKTTSYTVMKKWVGMNDTDYPMPDVLQVALKSKAKSQDASANDKLVAAKVLGDVGQLKTLLKTENYVDTFTGLPTHAYDADGNAIALEYYVEEQEVKGFIVGSETPAAGIDQVIVNTLEPIAIKVVKTWEGEGEFKDMRRDVEFTLKRKVSGVEDNTFSRKDTITVDTTENVQDVTFTGLPKYKIDSDGTKLTFLPYTYYVTETKIPSYKSEIKNNVTVGDQNNWTINVTNTLLKTRLEVIKVWEDEFDGTQNYFGQRTDTVEFDVFRNDETDPYGHVSVPVLKNADGTTFKKTETAVSLEELPAYSDADNKVPFEYTVKEVVPSGYTLTQGKLEPPTTAEGTWTYTATNSLAKVSITIYKMWNDEGFTKYRPLNELKITLTGYADCGNGLEEVVPAQEYKIPAKAGSLWQVTIDDLPKADKHGHEIQYKVEEATGLKAYVVSYENDKMLTKTATGLEGTITNKIAMINIKVKKDWDDNKNATGQRPKTLTVSLIANGDTDNPLKTLTLVPEPWEGDFGNYPKVDDDGEIITYAVVEQTMKGYERVTLTTDRETDDKTGNITLLLKNKQILKNLAIKKVWDDTGFTGNRPAEIEFTVTGTVSGKTGSVYTTTAKLDTAKDEVTVTGLPVYDVDGDVISYTVTETKTGMLDYTDTYNQPSWEKDHETDNMKATVTNTLPTIVFRAEKTWNDKDYSGSRPTSLVVELLAGKNSMSPAVKVTLNEANEWKADFGTFPKYSKGTKTEIVYSVKETIHTGYTIAKESQLTTPVEEGGKVVFKLENNPKLTSLTINKTWVGDGSYTTYRPAALTFDIVGTVGTTQVVKTSTGMAITAGSNAHSVKVSNLPVYDKTGALITYTVTEATTNSLKGYTVSVGKVVTGTDGTMTAAVTNTLTTIKIGVKKTWTGVTTGVTVPTVTILLKANGTTINSSSSTFSNGTEMTYTVPKYDKDGKEITYTVEESPQPTGNFSYVSTTTETKTGYEKYFVVTNKYTAKATPTPTTPTGGGGGTTNPPTNAPTTDAPTTTPPADDPTTPPETTPIPTPPVDDATPSPTPTTGGASMTPGATDPSGGTNGGGNNPGGRMPGTNTPTNAVQRVEASEYFDDEDIPLSNGTGDHLHLGDCFD